MSTTKESSKKSLNDVIAKAKVIAKEVKKVSVKTELTEELEPSRS